MSWFSKGPTEVERIKHLEEFKQNAQTLEIGRAHV